MTDPKDVIDAIRNSNIDAARDSTRELLFKKAAEHMAARKEEIASTMSQTLSVDVDDVHTFEDVPTEVENEVTPEQETETPEPEEPTDATDHGDN